MKRSVEVKFWLFAALAYCTPNLVAFLGAQSGLFMEAVGDQLSLSFTTQLACIVSVLASFVLLVYCCHFGKSWFKSTRTAVPPRALGVIVFLFQLMGLWALLLYDFGRVGGVRASQDLIPRIISYIAPDALFIIHYSHCRPNKVPFLNLTLYCASSVLRGWSGFIVIIFAIEIYFILNKLFIQIS